MPEAKTDALVVPTQEAANAFKAQAILNRDAKAADDELPPPVVHDPPAPTQAEANEIKVQSALGGADITAPVNVDVPHAQPATANVGDSLSCTMGNWDMQPSAYSYQWFRDGSDEVGSGASYVVGADDAGHSLTCVVTASNAIGLTVAPPSNAVAIPASRAARADEHHAAAREPAREHPPAPKK